MTNLPVKQPQATFHIIIAIDTFCKFVVLDTLPDKSAASVATFLRTRIFTTYGPPARLRSDNGTEFAGVVDAALDFLGIQHLRSSPYHSEGEGTVERYIRTLRSLLSRNLVGMPAHAFTTFLPELQFVMNATHNVAIGTSPYLLMFGAPAPPLVPSLASH